MQSFFVPTLISSSEFNNQRIMTTVMIHNTTSFAYSIIDTITAITMYIYIVLCIGNNRLVFFAELPMIICWRMITHDCIWIWKWKWTWNITLRVGWELEFYVISWGYKGNIHIHVAGLEHEFYFSIYWEFHHPNWRSHIFQRGRSTTNQYIYITIDVYPLVN